MAERYNRIYELGGARYADGAPVFLCAGALLEDKLSRSTLVQLKLKNISERTVIAVKVAVTPLSPDGEELGRVEYLYKNLKAKRDQDFGQKTAIVIHDSKAVSFIPTVVQVVFDDESSWEGEDSLWTEIKAPRTLLDAFGDDELSTQFAIRYGDDCTFLPQDDRGLWFCACGLINREDESKCHGCRRVYSALKAVNFTSLRSESKQRQETEKQLEDEDRAEQGERRKKMLKLSLVLVPVLICLIFVMATVPKYMSQKRDYATACALLETGEFDRAAAAFATLGSYADSEEQIKYNIPYEKARFVLDCARSGDTAGLLLLDMKRSELAEDETVSVALYKQADIMFGALGDYKDSQTRREEAQAAVKVHYDSLISAEYDAAAALLEARSFLAARDAFIALGNYKDSSELAADAPYRRACLILELAEKYSMRGVYSSISRKSGVDSVFYVTPDAFAELGSTVSADIREIFRSDGVEIKIESVPESGFVPLCSDIEALFTELGSYKDSAERAARAAAAGDFTRPFYELCANGQLYEAYLWLNAYPDEFPSREDWKNVLETYGPYCGTWELKAGDPTLIPMTIGIPAQCSFFTSSVIIKDYVISLRIFVNGSTDYPIELPLAAEGGRFSINLDGANTYIAALSNTGSFNYSKYSSYALSSQTNSCEYAKIG